MPDYGSPGYWDSRYAAEEGNSFDWYQSWATLKPYLSPFLSTSEDFEVLVPGCGNSRLPADLYDEGIENITSIDISPVVINQMSDRYVEREEMEFTVMDACNMEFIPDGCFDAIIDKALFDSMLCTEDNLTAINSLTQEMCRVLKPGGVYIIISYGLPGTRLGYLNRGLDWAVEHVAIPKPQLDNYAEQGSSDMHYAYICKKIGGAAEDEQPAP